MSNVTDDCTRIRERLSGYLDGDLDDRGGTEVRTHLRECASCRAVSVDEAALRDGLRTLPPLDPPAHLWANVRRQLAEAEAVVAKQPAWKRAFGRAQAAVARNLRSIAAGSALAAAAAVAFVVWHGRPAAVDTHEPIASVPAPTVTPPVPKATQVTDVTDELAHEPAHLATEYATAAAEVLALADAARPEWSADKRTAYDAHLVELRAAIADARDTRGARRGWRALIRYVQISVARDDLALADTAGGAP